MNLNEAWIKLDSDFKIDQISASLKLDWILKERDLRIGINAKHSAFLAFELTQVEFARARKSLGAINFNSFDLILEEKFTKNFIEIHLKQKYELDLFFSFTKDIADFVSNKKFRDRAPEAIISRITAWDNFFEKGSLQLMSHEVAIGLWGELKFISELFDNHNCDFDLVIDCWQKDIGLDKDFRFSSLSVEVKTSTKKNMQTVRISSEQQLTPAGDGEPLFLWCYSVSANHHVKTSLVQLIDSCEARLKTTKSFLRFYEILGDFGYIGQHREMYNDYNFGVNQLSVFKVTPGFPSITFDAISTELSNVEYDLNIGMCAAYMADPNEVYNEICK